MVPFRVNLLIMRQYGVPSGSRFLDEVAEGLCSRRSYITDMNILS